MNLGELLIEFGGDFSKLERDIEQAKRKAAQAAKEIEDKFNQGFTVGFKVDESKLESLNKHLEKKRTHLISVQNYFNSHPLTIKTNDKNLVDTNKLLDKITSKPYVVDVKVKVDNSDLLKIEEKIKQTNANQNINSSPAQSTNKSPVKVEIETSDLIKQIQSVENSIKSISKKNLLGDVISAPFKLAIGSIKTVLQGLVIGITQPIGNDIGKGIKDGIEENAGEIIGSFNFISKKISSNFAEAIVDALEQDAGKIQSILLKISGTSKDEILLEKNAVKSGIQAKSKARQNLGTNQIIEDYDSVIKSIREISAKKSDISKRRKELLQHYEKINGAMQKAMERMGIKEIESQIDSLSKDLNSTIAQLSNLDNSSNIDSEALIKKSSKIQKEISILSDRISTIVDVVNDKYSDFIEVLDRENDQLNSEEKKLEKKISPLENIKKIKKAPVKNPDENLPELYKQIFNQVAAISDVDPSKVSIPRLVADSTMPARVGGKYSTDSNEIKVPKETYEKIIAGELKDIEEFVLETIVHELRHGVQFNFGKVNALQNKAAVPLMRPSPEQAAKLGEKIEVSTASGSSKGANSNKIRDLESDAYTFADKNTKSIIQNLTISQFQQKFGIGGGKASGGVRISEIEALNTLKKVQELAKTQGLDITSELEETKKAISSVSQSFKPLIDKAANVEFLPTEEINSLSENLINYYHDAISQIEGKVNSFKNTVFSKITSKKNQQTELATMPMEDFKSSLNEEYTAKGLRQVVKRLGTVNYNKRSKEDLIEIIASADRSSVDPILSELGGSIKKVKYQKESPHSVTPLSSSNIIQSLKEGNRKLQSKLKELKSSNEENRQNIIEQILINTNKQISEIDNLVKTKLLSGDLAKKVSGYRSYFEQVRQPLAGEYTSNNANKFNTFKTKAKVKSTLESKKGVLESNNDLDLYGFNDINEFFNNLLKRVDPDKDKQLIDDIARNAEVITAKFEAVFAKYEQISSSVSDRYNDAMTGRSRRVKRMSKKQRKEAMSSPDIQNDPEARSYAISANIQENLNKFDRAESIIENRYIKSFKGGDGLTKFIQSLKKTFESNPLFDTISNKFNMITSAGLKLGAAFLGFQALSTLIPLFSDFSKKSIEVATSFENLERRLKFVSGGFAEGQKNIDFFRSNAKRLNVDIGQSLNQGGAFAAVTRETSLEGAPTRNIVGSIQQASAVLGADTQQQERALLALSQMAGKTVISQEELRQQLSEALPGAAQAAARAYGMTTQQMNILIEKGLILADDFLPRLAQQLSAETASGVPGAARTSQAAIGKFNNSLIELQESLGKSLIPLRNFSLSAVSNALNAVTNLMPTLVNAFQFLVILLAKPIWMPLIKGLMATQFSFAGVAKAARLAGETIKDFSLLAMKPMLALATQFVAFEAVIVIFNAIKVQFTDFAQEITDGSNQIKDAIQEMNKTFESMPNQERSFSNILVPWVAKNESELRAKINADSVERLLDGDVKGYFTEESAGVKVKRYKDLIKASNQLIGNSQQFNSNLQGEEFNNQLSQLKEIDKQIESTQNKRRALAQNSPDDAAGLRALIGEEQKLFKAREKAFENPGKSQATLATQVQTIQKAIELLENQKKKGEIFDESKYNQTMQGLKKTLAETNKEQDKLGKSLKSSLSDLLKFERGWSLLNAKLEDGKTNIEKAANVTKYLTSIKLITGEITPGQSEFINNLEQQEVLTRQIALNTADIKKRYSDLNAVGASTLLADSNIDQKTSPAELRVRAEESKDNPRLQSILNKFAEVKELENQTNQMASQMADQRASLSKQLSDSNKSVAEYFLSVQRQAKELAITAKEITNEVAMSRVKSKLKSALVGFQDDFVSQFVDSLIGIMDTLNQQTKDSLQAQQQKLQNQNNFIDSEKQRTEMYRNLPILPVPQNTQQVQQPTQVNSSSIPRKLGKVSWVEKSSSSMDSDPGHVGDDIFAPIGSKIYSPVSGKVVQSRVGGTKNTDDANPLVPGYQPQQLVIIKLDMPIEFEGKKITHLNMRHLLDRNVEVGQKVKMGDLIGTIGEAGGRGTQFGTKRPGTPRDADAAHLHIEYAPSENNQRNSLRDAQASRLTAILSQQFRNGVIPGRLPQSTVQSVMSQSNNSGGNSNGILWGRANQYSRSDFSGLTSVGKKAMEALKNPNVRAFLDAIAVAEVGNVANSTGGYGYLFGDNNKETFNVDKLFTHPRQRRKSGRHVSSATGRYQTMDFVWDDDTKYGSRGLGLKDFKPQSQEVLAVGRMMYRGILDAVMKGNIKEAVQGYGLKNGAYTGARYEWASLQGNTYGQGTPGGKISAILSNFEKFKQNILSGSGGNLPNLNTPNTVNTPANTSVNASSTSTADAQNQLNQAGELARQNLNQQNANIETRLQGTAALAQIEANLQQTKANVGLRDGLRGLEDNTRQLQRNLEDLEKQIGYATPSKELSDQIDNTSRSYFDYNQGLLRKQEELAGTVAKTKSSIAILERIDPNTLPPGFDLQGVVSNLKAVLPAAEAALAQVDNLLIKSSSQYIKAIADLQDKAAIEAGNRYQESTDALIQSAAQGLKTRAAAARAYMERAMPGDLSRGNPIALEAEASKMEITTTYHAAIRDLDSKIRTTSNKQIISMLQAQKQNALVALLRGFKDIEAQSQVQTTEYNLQVRDSNLNIQDRFMQSRNNVHSARSESYKMYGMDRTAQKYDYEIAVNNQNLDYERQLLEIDRFAASIDIPVEKVKELKDNLREVNEIKLDNIRAQFDPMTEIIKNAQQSTEGFFKSAILDSGNLGDAFKNMVNSIIDNLAIMASQMLSQGLFDMIGGGFGGKKQQGGGGGGFFGGLLNGIIGVGSGFLGGLFGGGGGGGDFGFGSYEIGDMSTGTFANGGIVPNYAGGGIAGKVSDALTKERSMTGRQPKLVVVSEGERILNHQQTQQWNRMQSANKLNFAEGGMVTASSGINASAIGGGTTVNVPMAINVNAGSDTNVDAVRLRQVLNNDIQAAIKRETRPGGSISRSSPYSR